MYGLGDDLSIFTVDQLDGFRTQVLQKLREVRAQMVGLTDPTLLAKLKVAEAEGVAALGQLATAANTADQPALWARAANVADAAVRAMGSAVAEVVIAIGTTAGTAGKAAAPLLWPLAIGLIAVAFIMGGGIRLPKGK